MKAKLSKVWDMLEAENATRLDHIDDSLFYKRICVSKHEDKIEVYDTSTEIYRPLTSEEIEMLLTVGAKNFVKILQLKNLTDRFMMERANYQREAIKGNQKKHDYYFNKAKKLVKRLKEII